jgi:hypothetical protein
LIASYEHNLFEIDFTGYEMVFLSLRAHENDAIESGSLPESSGYEDWLPRRR